MCKMASFVLTKDNAYWSKRTDSHEEIIEEHGLKELGLAGKVGILRVEIVPKRGDYMQPIDQWVFGYDQDMLPDWADKETDERRTRAALREWYSACFVPAGVERAEVKAGDVVKLVWGGTVNAVWGGTVNEVWGGTVNEVCGGTVEFRVAFACKLTGALAVVINRIGAKAKCYVGTAKTRTVTGK